MSDFSETQKKFYQAVKDYKLEQAKSQEELLHYEQEFQRYDSCLKSLRDREDKNIKELLDKNLLPNLSRIATPKLSPQLAKAEIIKPQSEAKIVAQQLVKSQKLP